jgi:hypothetical protein
LYDELEKGICQMKSHRWGYVLFLFIFGCSFFNEKPNLNDQNLLHDTKPQWFAHSKNYQLLDREYNVRPHLFFDMGPEWSDRHQEINFYPLALEGQTRTLDIDLLSGQRFFHYDACAKNDLWNENQSRVLVWPFTMGYIPRMIDQIGFPQKIVVFGARKIFSLDEDRYYRVKVIGGYVEQVCLYGRCREQNSWLSRMVLIGVNQHYSEWSQIASIEELKKKIDWRESKFAIENLGGGNTLGEKIVPSVKASEPVELNDVMPYLKQRRIAFASKELVGLRSSCSLLYEKFWQDVGVQTLLDKPALTTEEVKNVLAFKQKIKSEGKPATFKERLSTFTKKYMDDFVTCSKFHYVGNVNENPERFWFLSYMQIYMQLHKDGYFYDCRGKTWLLNTKPSKGERIYDLKKDLFLCSDEEIDQAFSYLGVALKNLRTEAPFSYRFIDYDNHELGTHQKIYSWVKEKNRAFTCNEIEYKKMVKTLPIMPIEAKWQKRFHKDKRTEMGIIE